MISGVRRFTRRDVALVWPTKHGKVKLYNTVSLISWFSAIKKLMASDSVFMGTCFSNKNRSPARAFQTLNALDVGTVSWVF